MEVTPALSAVRSHTASTSGSVSFWNVVWYTLLTGWVILAYAWFTVALAVRVAIGMLFATRVYKIMLLIAAIMSFFSLPAVASSGTFLDAAQTVLDIFDFVWNNVLATPLNDALFCFRWIPIWLNGTIDFVETMFGIIAVDGFGIDLFAWAVRLREARSAQLLQRETVFAWAMADEYLARPSATGPLASRARAFVRRAEAAGLLGPRLTVADILDFVCEIGAEIFSFLSDLLTIFSDFVIFILKLLIEAINAIGAGNVSFLVELAIALVETMLDAIDPKNCFHPITDMPSSMFVCLCPNSYSSLSDVPSALPLAILGCVCSEAQDLSTDLYEAIIILTQECVSIPFLQTLLDAMQTFLNWASEVLSGLQGLINVIYVIIGAIQGLIGEIGSILDGVKDILDSLDDIFDIFRDDLKLPPPLAPFTVERFSNETWGDPHAFAAMFEPLKNPPRIAPWAGARAHAPAWAPRSQGTPAERGMRRLREFYGTGRASVLGDAISTRIAQSLAAHMHNHTDAVQLLDMATAQCDGLCVEDAAVVLTAARDLWRAYTEDARSVRFEANGRVVRRSDSEREAAIRGAFTHGFVQIRGSMRRMAAAVRAKMAPSNLARVQAVEGHIARAFLTVALTLAPGAAPDLAERLGQRGPHVRDALGEGFAWLERHMGTWESARNNATQANVPLSAEAAKRMAQQLAPGAMRSDEAWLRSGAASSWLLRDYYHIDPKTLEAAEPRFFTIVIGVAVVGAAAAAAALTLLGVAVTTLVPLLFLALFFLAPVLFLVVFPVFGHIVVAGVTTFAQNGKPGGVDFFTPILALIADGVYESFMTGWSGFDFGTFVATLGDYGVAYANYLLIEFVRQVLLLGSLSSPPHCSWDRATGLPDQTVVEWIGDILMCNPNDVCATPLDWPGEAPCLCSINPSDPNEWRTRYGSEAAPCVDGSNNPIGHRLCWPRQNEGFNIPEVDLASTFDLQCEALGYDVSGIASYQGVSAPRMMWNWERNGYAAVKQLTRIFSKGVFLPWIGLLGYALRIIPIVGRLGRRVAKITLFWNTASYITVPVSDWAITYLSGPLVFSWLRSTADEALTFLRYDNYDALNPKGSLETRDVLCLVIHLPLLVLALVMTLLVVQVSTLTVFAGGVWIALGIFVDLVLRVPMIVYMLVADILYVPLLYRRRAAAEYADLMAPGVDIPSARYEAVARNYGLKPKTILRVTARMRARGESVPPEWIEAETYASHARERMAGRMRRLADHPHAE
jgi:hypothetical protein